MFDVGQLVIIIRSDGLGPVEAPPALIVKKYMDIPKSLLQTENIIVYDILFMGSIEKRIDGEWLCSLL
jgi:hypothetical protein|tara:strand:+ start:97 stop:300 length:204 start_codon:yes stop_codon:yes gene_type:complete